MMTSEATTEKSASVKINFHKQARVEIEQLSFSYFEFKIRLIHLIRWQKIMYY